jgi:hypothetical protein
VAERSIGDELFALVNELIDQRVFGKLRPPTRERDDPRGLAAAWRGDRLAPSALGARPSRRKLAGSRPSPRRYGNPYAVDCRGAARWATYVEPYAVKKGGKC